VKGGGEILEVVGARKGNDSKWEDLRLNSWMQGTGCWGGWNDLVSSLPYSLAEFNYGPILPTLWPCSIHRTVKLLYP